MRKLVLSLALAMACALAASAAHAQVTDAERGAARELFRQGDELQHQGHLAEALDKFQRAQQVFSAPTNLLRMAECQAGLGKLVEATETYRLVLRAPLAPDSPPAFQTAIDQAKNELPQLEPLVPKLTIEARPPGLAGLGLQIDGQTVPAALLGTPIPLDPGPHTIAVFAQGFASAPQRVLLQEHDAKTVTMALQPLPPSAYAVSQGTLPPPQAPLPAPAYGNAPAPYPTQPAVYASPVPPAAPPAPRKPSASALMGLHFGDEVPAGQVPTPGGGSANLTDVAGNGFGYGLDGGLRFARSWYIGATMDHAELDSGANKSSTTMLGAVLSLITNPDRVSFYLSIGVAARWYSQQGQPVLSSGEFLPALGVWIPLGNSVRLLPEFTASFGNFVEKTSTTTFGGTTLTTNGDQQGHQFYMLGVAGFYNIDL